MRRPRSLIWLVGLLCLGFPSSAWPNDANVFDAADVVADTELDLQRGGFRWDGLDIAVGAQLRSYISDVLVVQTNISWINSQVDVQRMAAEGAAPLSSSDLAAILGNSGLSSNLNVGSAYLVNNGNTAVIQRADFALQNIIVNSASNVDIRQELNAQLDIANFGPFQSDLISDRITGALGSMIGLAGMGN